MKTFYIIIIALAVMVFGIYYNGRELGQFISQTVDDLAALEFADGNDAQIFELAERIERGMDRFTFCISRQQTDAVNDYASLLKTQTKLGEYAELEVIRTLLTDILTDIGKADKLSLREIF